jgi:hypothetical protein
MAQSFLTSYARELVETEDALDDSINDNWCFVLDPLRVDVSEIVQNRCTCK